MGKIEDPQIEPHARIRMVQGLISLVNICGLVVLIAVMGKIFLKGVMPILTCVIITLNWLTLTPKTHFSQIYLKLTFNFLFWGKNKYVTLQGMRLL